MRNAAAHLGRLTRQNAPSNWLSNHMAVLRNLAWFPSHSLRSLYLEIVPLAENNALTGIIPDNLDATSHLRVLVAFSNKLTGSIPSTLGLVPYLEVSN